VLFLLVVFAIPFITGFIGGYAANHTSTFITYSASTFTSYSTSTYITTIYSTSYNSQTQTVVNGAISVPAGSYVYTWFSAPLGVMNVDLRGNFTVSGGSDNEVVMIIMDSSDFVNWQNSAPHNFLYYSGPTTTGNITADNLIPGNIYYIVYNNQLPSATAKSVQVTVVLTYLG
jgi:hypothetical protein